ncbi:hypothetical protein QN402_31565, partial [Pseudomonas sp. FG1]|nr:hypothetical protein [Pseudomonas sp. FG1]
GQREHHGRFTGHFGLGTQIPWGAGRDALGRVSGLEPAVFVGSRHTRRRRDDPAGKWISRTRVEHDTGDGQGALLGQQGSDGQQRRDRVSPEYADEGH